MSDAIRRAHEKIEQLLQRAAELKAGEHKSHYGFSVLDGTGYTSWRMSALAVIKSLAGGSHFETEFNDIDEKTNLGQPWQLGRQSALLAALLDEVDGGFLVSIRQRIRAEVSLDFLSQADRLLEDGNWQASAVIISAVLEDHIRALCAKYPAVVLPAKPKLDGLNRELAKAGAYDALVQGQITVWASLCEKAVHGHWTELSADNVRDLLRDTRRFLAEHPA